MSNEIGVRYCGGCNTTYDRAAAVKQLQELLPDCSYVIAEAGKRYGAALIVDGCFCACTSTLTLAVPKDRQVRIGGFEDVNSARDRLRELFSPHGKE